MGGDMTGRSPTREDYEILGGEDCMPVVGYFFLVLGEFGFEVLGEPLQGAPSCWGFWARGPRFLTVSYS
jgi:hypothetical protein